MRIHVCKLLMEELAVGHVHGPLRRVLDMTNVLRGRLDGAVLREAKSAQACDRTDDTEHSHLGQISFFSLMALALARSAAPITSEDKIW